MRTRGLVIFAAFNSLVTSRRGSKRTFLAGLVQAGIRASTALLADLQAASEGLDHSRWSVSRPVYCGWTAETLAALAQVGAGPGTDLGSNTGTVLVGQLTPRVVSALEQWHQASMVALPTAADCLARLKRAGFAIALCSNWGWDLAADLAGTGLTGYIDVFVTSAQAGYRKPHMRIYQATIDLAGFRAEDAVFIGDSLRTDALGPQRAGIRSVLVTRAKQQVHREQVLSLSEAVRLILRGPAPLHIPPSHHPDLHGPQAQPNSIPRPPRSKAYLRACN
jgi:HAD superfamily hydrolase (TIGR01509 family)